jgi:hypothetical protein
MRGTLYRRIWRSTVYDLRLHAGDAAQHHDGAVEHAQRPLDLDREVDVAGGVDDVDVVRLDADLGRAARPGAVGRGRLDGDAALALQLHRVHLGATPSLPFTSWIAWIRLV